VGCAVLRISVSGGLRCAPPTLHLSVWWVALRSTHPASQRCAPPTLHLSVWWVALRSAHPASQCLVGCAALRPPYISGMFFFRNRLSCGTRKKPGFFFVLYTDYQTDRREIRLFYFGIPIFSQHAPSRISANLPDLCSMQFLFQMLRHVLFYSSRAK